MLTRFIRIQLAVFTAAAVIGVSVMALVYMQAPTFFGIGRISVTLKLPEAGGLYRFANVTYRGVQIGKVMAVDYTPEGADAELSLEDSPKIPSDVVARVRNVSAVGEQYVDLQPRTSSPPYLRSGDTIGPAGVEIPAPVGPMLDKTSELLASVPKDSLRSLLDESARGFGGSGYELGSLLDSTSVVARELRDGSQSMAALVDDSVPLLDGQAQSADDLRTWSAALSGVTDQLVASDPQVRHVLNAGPGAFDEVSRLLTDVKPTLPILLSNLGSLGKVALTYNPSLEQLLVLLPPFLGAFANTGPDSNATGYPKGNFRIQVSDPGACTVGFLPATERRSPADTSTVDTPDGLYCKLPQDSPIAVRGARNLPCMGHPGKRAPTVEICDSDREFEPLAIRQHILGPDPLDPNLIAQGIPPDSRVPGEQGIYAPTTGTPLPPDAPPRPNLGPDAAPASARIGAAGPAVASAKYDPRTGRFVGSDGLAYQQTDLVGKSSTWQDLLLAGGGA